MLDLKILWYPESTISEFELLKIYLIVPFVQKLSTVLSFLSQRLSLLSSKHFPRQKCHKTRKKRQKEQCNPLLFRYCFISSTSPYTIKLKVYHWAMKNRPTVVYLQKFSNKWFQKVYHVDFVSIFSAHHVGLYQINFFWLKVVIQGTQIWRYHGFCKQVTVWRVSM